MSRKVKAIFGAIAVCIMLMGISVARAATDKEANKETSEEEGKEAQDFEVYTLGEIYVTGEKPSASEEASLTTVISAEDIKATNSLTVAEALSFVNGVDVAMGQKNLPRVSIHGLFDQSRILVLIDGVPYFETFNGPLNLTQIPTDNIAKIEVIKGSSSVLYGTNAMGGVINIITKKPVEKPSSSLTLEAGQVDNYRASVSHGMKKGIYNYWLNYSHHQSHGWKMASDFDPGAGTITTYGATVTKTPAVLENGGTRDNSDIKTDSLWLKFGIDPNPDSEYYINLHYINTDKGSPFSPANVNVYSAKADKPAFSDLCRLPKYEDWGFDLSGQQKVQDGLVLKSKLFYHHHVDDYVSYSDSALNNLIATSRWKDYLVGGSLITELQPIIWDTIRLSFSYRGESHRDRDDKYLPFTRYFSYNGSAGLEDEFTPVENSSVVIGCSYDWLNITDARQNSFDNAGNFTGQVDKDNRDAMTEFNPMIGATYTFADSTKLFASSARKTHFPTLNLLFNSRFGNEDLNAETSINSEVGVSRSLSSFAWGQLAFFRHDISDLISLDYTNINNKAQNFAKAEMYGLELNTEVYPRQDLTLKAGYTLNHASDRSPDRETGKLVNVPEHKLDVAVQYTIPYSKTRLDLSGSYMGEIYTKLPTPKYPTQAEEKVGGYTIFNARLSQKFQNHYEAYLAVNNLFDKNYAMSYAGSANLPGPGRNILAGITANF